MARAEIILTAVRRIHEAPLRADGWARALPSIAAASASQQVNFHVLDARGREVRFVTAYGLHPDHHARFRASAAAGSFPHWWKTVPVGAAARRSAMWPDREFLRSAFYNEVVRHAGSLHGIHVPLVRTPERHVHMMLAREAGLEDYGDNDVEAIATLVPHIMTALQVSHRLAAVDLQAAGACMALDQLSTGVVLVDSAEKILFANLAAETVLNGGNEYGAERGGSRTGDRHIAHALRRLIASCTSPSLVDGRPGEVELARGEGRPPLKLVAVPVRGDAEEIDLAWIGAARPAAVVVIIDPAREQNLHKDSLRRRFGLTPAEADVAVEIAKGDGREATAVRLGISTATVRAHLSSIFGKTGVRRQAELVRLLMQDRG